MLGLNSASGLPARRLIRSTLIGVASLLVLLIAWHKLGSSTQIAPVQFSPVMIVLALAGGALFLVGRAWRFHVLLNTRTDFAPLVAQTGVSWGVGLLLPGPSADATFVVLLRRMGISARRGASVAFVGRVLDVISLALVAVFASAMDGVDEPRDPVVITAIVGIVFLAGLIVCLRSSGRALIARGLSRIPRFRSMAVDVDQSLGELGNRRQLVLLTASTAVCRLATFIEYAALFAMLNVQLDFWSVWFVLAMRTFLSTIPVQGLAGLGTGQLWWTSALVLEGIPAATAVGISITVSLLDMAVSAPLAIGCWVLLRSTSKRTKSVRGSVQKRVSEKREVEVVA